MGRRSQKECRALVIPRKAGCPTNTVKRTILRLLKLQEGSSRHGIPDPFYFLPK